MTESGFNTIDSLVSRYSALGAESSTTSFTTGPDESTAIGELWSREVQRTRQAFRFTSWTLQHCLDIRMSMVLQHDIQGNTVRGDGRPGPKVSDNRLTQLVYEDNAQTLVSMIEMRDMFNYQVVHIARYPLRAGTILSLKLMVDFDNEYREEHPGVE